MTTSSANLNSTTLGRTQPLGLRRYLPFLGWLVHYERKNLTGDIIAGLIVAVMLVPQSMAYALLAGLPPQVGLYASIAPLLIYGLLGTSRALAVGPVAMVSLLVAAGIGSLNPQGVEQYVAYALTLALLVGLIQLGMGLLRVGFLVNFLSHPVLSGFTSAAALVIGGSQLKHIFGLDVPRGEFTEMISHTLQHLGRSNGVTVLIATAAILILLFFKYPLKRLLRRAGLGDALVLPLTKIGPLVIVILGILVVSVANLGTAAGVSIVGDVPAGLPPLTVPLFDMDVIATLLPIALTISLVGYMESISVAKSLASKRRQKVDANQELVALGAANLGAAFTGGYPVTGGISRSLVNFTAGANTGLASIITAGLIALTVLTLTPLFYNLPNAVLAAIILVAIVAMLDWRTFTHTWHYNKLDAISLAVTFFAVLLIGIETGILIGAAVSMGLYLWRTSKPHVAVVGRIEGTEHFRNVQRHEVETYPKLLLIRIDESLYFPNAQFLEECLLAQIADNPQIEHLVLICSAVNYIDSSALDVLEQLQHELADAGVTLYMAEVKGPVMDKLRHIGFVDELGKDRIFMTTHQAVQALAKNS